MEKLEFLGEWANPYPQDDKPLTTSTGCLKLLR